MPETVGITLVRGSATLTPELEIRCELGADDDVAPYASQIDRRDQDSTRRAYSIWDGTPEMADDFLATFLGPPWKHAPG